MKKTLRAISIILLSLILAVAFASCARTLSDTYSAEVAGTGLVLEFDESGLIIKYMLTGKEVARADATYSIEEDKITISVDTKNEDINKINGTFDFLEGDDYIKIGGITYREID